MQIQVCSIKYLKARRLLLLVLFLIAIKALLSITISKNCRTKVLFWKNNNSSSNNNKTNYNNNSNSNNYIINSKLKIKICSLCKPWNKISWINLQRKSQSNLSSLSNKIINNSNSQWLRHHSWQVTTVLTLCISLLIILIHHSSSSMVLP